MTKFVVLIPQVSDWPVADHDEVNFLVHYLFLIGFCDCLPKKFKTKRLPLMQEATWGDEDPETYEQPEHCEVEATS